LSFEIFVSIDFTYLTSEQEKIHLGAFSNLAKYAATDMIVAIQMVQCVGEGLEHVWRA
jgi:hypothetical protein